MNLPPPSPRQARTIWFALTSLAVALTLAIVGLVFWGLGQGLMALSPVLWPIAVAGVVAVILDPVVDWLAVHRVPRLRAILLVFGGAGLLVLGAFASILPRALVEARDLAGRVPVYIDVAQARLENLLSDPPAPLLKLLPESWQREFRTRFPAIPAVKGRGDGPEAVPDSAPEGASAVATNVPPAGAPAADEGERPPNGLAPSATDPSWWTRVLDPKALKSAGGWLGTVASEVGQWMLGQVGRVASWLGVLAGLALIPIYAFYFLLEKSSIERRWTDYLPVSDSRFKDELVWLLRNINDALIVFFRGQVLVAICDGILYGIGFLAIGLPYALLLGLVAMFLTIVPFLGAIVTCASALAIAVIQFGDWQHPLLVLGVFMVVQTLEGWVIQPKIIGDRVGLHPVTIIIALLVGTTLMGGLLGGLLAIPATAVLRALMFRYIWRAGQNGDVASP